MPVSTHHQILTLLLQLDYHLDDLILSAMVFLGSRCYWPKLNGSNNPVLKNWYIIAITCISHSRGAHHLTLFPSFAKSRKTIFIARTMNFGSSVVSFAILAFCLSVSIGSAAPVSSVAETKDVEEKSKLKSDYPDAKLWQTIRYEKSGRQPQERDEEKDIFSSNYAAVTAIKGTKKCPCKGSGCRGCYCCYA